MLIVLDRIEGSWAIFDSPEGEVRLPVETLYTGAREGDVCVYEGGRLTYSPEQTKKTRSRMEALSNSLFDE